MSTKNLKLKRAIIVLVSLALLLMPNFIVFADGADDTPTTPDTEQIGGDESGGGDEEQPGDDGSGSGDEEQPGDDGSGSGDEEQPGDDGSGSGDEEQPGDDGSGSGDEEQPGDDGSGSGDEEQPGDDGSGSGDEEQPGDDGSGSGDEEQPDDDESGGDEEQLEMAPMLQGASMQFSGGGGSYYKTLTFLAPDVNGLNYYTYSYTWYDYWGEHNESGQKNAGESLTVSNWTTVKVGISKKDGYNHLGYSQPSNSNDATIDIQLNNNKSVKAVFEQSVTYKRLTFVDFPGGLDEYDYSYDGGSGTMNGGEYINVPQGKVVIVTAHANSGWHQVGWSEPDDPANTGSVTVTMSEPRSVAATFAENPVYYELKFLNNAGYNYGGYFMINGDATTKYYHNSTAQILKGTEITVTAYAEDGYYFDKWKSPTPGTKTDNTVTFTMNGPETVKGSFNKLAKLVFHYNTGLESYSYKIDDGAEITVSPTPTADNNTTVYVPTGKEIHVYASPASAYENDGWYSGWSGGVNYDGHYVSNTSSGSTYDFKAKFKVKPQKPKLVFHYNEGLDYYEYKIGSGSKITVDPTPTDGNPTVIEVDASSDDVHVYATPLSTHLNDGWFTNGSFDGDHINSTSNDQIYDFKAKFITVPTEYTLTLYNNDGLDYYTYSVDGGTAQTKYISGNSGTVTIPANKPVVLRAYAKNTHTNNGWAISPEGATEALDNMVKFVMDGNKSAKASFSQKAMLVFYYNYGLGSYSYTIDGGAAITVSPTPALYYPTTVYVPAGKEIDVYATAAAGYDNDGWYDGWYYGINFNGNHVSSTSSSSTYSFIANFKEEPTEYTLTLYSNDGLDYYTYSVDGGAPQTKYISGNSGTVTIPAGKPVVLIAYAKNTHSNNGWPISPEGAAPALDNMVEFVMNGDKSAQASFTREYWILKFLSSDHLDHYSYEINGGGETTATVGQDILVPVNASVKMWAYAETLYKFKTWTPESPGYSYNHYNPESFTMTQDETAQAEFEEDGYWLYLDKSDPGISSYTVAYGTTTLTVDSSGSRLIPKNADVTVTANINSGRAFTGWSNYYTSPPTSGINKNVWVFEMDKDYSVKGNTVQLAGEKFRVTYESMLGTGSGTVEVHYNGDRIKTLSQYEHVDIAYIDGVNTVTVKAIPSSTPNSKFVKWHNYGVETAEMVIDLSTGQPSSAKCDVTLYINVKPEFARLGSLTVTKVDKDNTEKTLAGAKFTLSGNGIESQSRTTGDNGIAYWDNLPAGTYTLTEDIAPLGYSMPDPHQWTIRIGAYGGAYSIECCPTPYKWDISLEVKNKAEHCGLTITKIDESGNTITSPAATFKLYNNDTGNYTDEKTTVDGVVEWTNLIAGEYTIIEVSAPTGYYWQSQTHGISLTPNSNDGVWPNFEKYIKNYECASVKVVKKDQSNNAMEGITFTLTNSAGTVNLEAQTNSSGEITWDNLKPGDYTVTETIPSGYYMEDPNFESFSLANGDIKTVNFKNYKYASVKVIKKDQSGNAMEDVEFILKDDQGNQIGKTTTDENGEITWGSLKPGDYTVTETLPTGYYIIDTNPKSVTLANGSEETVEFVNYEYASIKVVKINQSDVPMKDVEFTLTDGQGTQIGKTTTDVTGEITWNNLKSGDYTVTETVPSGYYMVDPNFESFSLANGQQKTLNFKNYEYASVEVIKKDQSGNAIAGVKFTLTNTDGTVNLEDTTGPDGKITWSNLKTGSYTVTETIPDGYYMKDPIFQSFTLGNGETESLEFVNYKYASIKVIKGVNDQSLMEGVKFTLTNTDGTVNLDGYTDEFGEIIWENLKPDTYTVTETVEEGYYLTGDNPQTVILDNGSEETLNFMNYEYVEVYAMKQDINTGAALSGATFEIYATQNGAATGAALASRTTGANGKALFDKSVGLISGTMYWIKEVGAPFGYQNDAATANGYAVTINGYGTNNESDPVLFENTPILQSINVVKQIEGSPAGTLLDGTMFELYLNEGGVYNKKAEAALVNGTCSFTGLLPGDYKIVEVDGDALKFFTLAGDETRTLALVEEEGTSTSIIMNNTFTTASFSIVKRDSLNANVLLAGASYDLTGMQWVGGTFVAQTFRLTTAGGGLASVSGLTPGVYTLREVSAPAGYDIDPTVYTIDIMPGRSIEETYYVADDRLGSIVLTKFEQGSAVNTVDGASFTLYRVIGTTRTRIATGVTDRNGRLVFNSLPAGNYVLVETRAPANYTILGNGETAVTGLRVGETRGVVVYNGIVIVPPAPPQAPENLIVAAPPATPTPTPTPINTDELTIDDVDPAYGPETGEGDALFITIGILLLLGVALIIIRKKAILKNK